MNRRATPLFLVAVALACGACTEDERGALQEAQARIAERALVRFADEHLADEALTRAMPQGFDAIDINRSGYDRHRNRWITVGVQMEGPVRYFRAIFYVHPDEAAAHEMYLAQSTAHQLRGDRLEDDPQAEPFELGDLGIDNTCAVSVDRLFWCHAYKGSVYLVIQSSAAWPAGRNVSGAERKKAKQLLESFGGFLRDDVPVD